MHKAPVSGTGLGVDFFFFFLLISNDSFPITSVCSGKGPSISNSRRLSLLPAFELSLSDAVNSGADAFGMTLFSPSQP